MSKIIEGLQYTQEHEWISIEGNIATIGITDFAQSSLGDIVFVELPDEGEVLEATSSFGVVESIKSVSDLYSPLSGKILEKNSSAEDAPEGLNEDPFGTWLIKIEINTGDPALGKLMDSKAYKEYCEANA